MQETVEQYILRNERIAGGAVARVKVTQGNKSRTLNRELLLLIYGEKPVVSYRLTLYYE